MGIATLTKGKRTGRRVKNYKVIEGEEWRSIVGYEGLYEVSNFGRVKSLQSRWDMYKVKLMDLAISRTGKGYHTVCLTKNKKYFTRQVHRLVAEAFIPNPENKPEVNHIKGNTRDNRASELEWATKSENMKHSYDIGLHKILKGSKSPMSKLNEAQVLEIFNSQEKNGALAEKFNVTRDAISLIKTGKNWSHLTGKVYRRRENRGEIRKCCKCGAERYECPSIIAMLQEQGKYRCRPCSKKA